LYNLILHIPFSEMVRQLFSEIPNTTNTVAVQNYLNIYRVNETVKYFLITSQSTLFIIQSNFIVFHINFFNLEDFS